MELLNSLCIIESEQMAEDGREYVVRLNPEHFIYRAHFPGEPITPGVCILQTAVELLSLATDRKLSLASADNVKFLNVISPLESPSVRFSIRGIQSEDGLLKASVTASGDNVTFARMSVHCKEIVR